MPTDQPRQALSSQQAREAAYRLVARYYERERTAPILQLLMALSWARDPPNSDEERLSPWQACVQETLAGAPLPELPPPWDT